MLKIPMAAFGTAFIGNIWALSMFGVGLLLRAYGQPLTGVDINAHYIPHGVMVGAGLVALIQVVQVIRNKIKVRHLPIPNLTVKYAKPWVWGLSDMS